MLEEVRITGLGVIEDAVLEFSSGFTVVTGETGGELEDGILDHAEGGDAHFLKHRRATPPSRLPQRPWWCAHASR